MFKDFPKQPEMDRAGFNRVASEFWELCGQKTFWADPKKIALAKKAIGLAYLWFRPKDKEENEQVIAAFEAAMSNFIRRALMLGIDLTDLPSV